MMKFEVSFELFPCCVQVLIVYFGVHVSNWICIHSRSHIVSLTSLSFRRSFFLYILVSFVCWVFCYCFFMFFLWFWLEGWIWCRWLFCLFYGDLTGVALVPDGWSLILFGVPASVARVYMKHMKENKVSLHYKYAVCKSLYPYWIF